MSESINKRIIDAVVPIVPDCVPDHYEGETEEHCTFQYSEIPESFGDDSPEAIRYMIQLHYYAPSGLNTLTIRKALRRSIHGAGFTYPSVENASDELCQHYVLEFEDMDGEV